ncbi:hypothetical protein BKA70DRAFT_1525642 [Coprinopsis sp. MPI-PUGE-AT-0042]|nr:hypothetical protein BKA70DRAFT_1525642 [Coprinopsis sp. MPI-PUGE-AT-0042]
MPKLLHYGSIVAMFIRGTENSVQTTVTNVEGATARFEHLSEVLETLRYDKLGEDVGWEGSLLAGSGMSRDDRPLSFAAGTPAPSTYLPPPPLLLRWGTIRNSNLCLILQAVISVRKSSTRNGYRRSTTGLGILSEGTRWSRDVRAVPGGQVGLLLLKNRGYRGGFSPTDPNGILRDKLLEVRTVQALLTIEAVGCCSFLGLLGKRPLDASRMDTDVPGRSHLRRTLANHEAIHGLDTVSNLISRSHHRSRHDPSALLVYHAVLAMSLKVSIETCTSVHLGNGEPKTPIGSATRATTPLSCSCGCKPVTSEGIEEAEDDDEYPEGYDLDQVALEGGFGPLQDLIDDELQASPRDTNGLYQREEDSLSKMLTGMHANCDQQSSQEVILLISRPLDVWLPWFDKIARDTHASFLLR